MIPTVSLNRADRVPDLLSQMFFLPNGCIHGTTNACGMFTSTTILRPPSAPAWQGNGGVAGGDGFATLIGDGDVNIDEVAAILLALAGHAA